MGPLSRKKTPRVMSWGKKKEHKAEASARRENSSLSTGHQLCRMAYYHSACQNRTPNFRYAWNLS